MKFDQLFLKLYWSGNTEWCFDYWDLCFHFWENLISLSALLSWVTKLRTQFFRENKKRQTNFFRGTGKTQKNNHGLPILEMPEFLRFLRKTITENRPFTGGGSLFESKRGEENGPTGDWDQNSASSSTKSSCPLSIPKKVIPDGPIRLVHFRF